jgi:hypothetical protein
MGLSSAPSGERDREVLRASAARPTAGELAWLALLPCALLTAAAVLLLGPVVGRALLGAHGEQLWPHDAVYVFGHPEPVKHGRYLVALVGPVLLAAAVLVGARGRLRLRAEALRGLVLASQALLIAGIVAATVAQRRVAYTSLPPAWRIFTPRAFAAAFAASALLALAPRTPRVARRLAWLRSDSPRLRLACLAVAVAATALWLLPAITTEASIAGSPFPDLPPWAMGDAYAILDGRTPLVDFHPLYGHLWGYLAAIPMTLLDAKIAVFSSVMASGSALALLAVYAILRRIAGSPPLVLALYLPFLATSLFVVATAGPGVVSNSEIYSVWPMRYGGPLLLAWLTARHLDGAAPRRAWVLFLAGGLVAINNLEFGAGALAATLVAIACSPAAWSRAALRRLAASLLGGLLAAALLIALVTLVRAGELPRFGLLLEFPRLFGVLGLAELPLALVGFHLVIYATLAAALATAAVRVARRDPDVVLTGMLAWSAVFGLAAGSYFIGRSDGLKLAALMPSWALALLLLLVVTMRALAARDWRRPAPAELLVLLGFGLALCSLSQLPSPVHQLRRLRPAAVGAIYEQPDAHRLVARNARRGERVAIVIPMGHRIAYDLHLVNVSPYAMLDEIATRAQWRTLLAAIRAERAHKLFALTSHLAPEHRRALAAAGFSERAQIAQYSYWADGSVAR